MEQQANTSTMGKIIERILENRQQITWITLIAFNFCVAAISRGGITLLGNVAFGISLLILLPLIGYDLIKKKQNKLSLEILLGLIFLALFLLSFVYRLNEGYGLSELLLFGGGSSIMLYLASTKPLKSTEVNNIVTSVVILSTVTVIVGIYVYLQFPIDRFVSFFYNFEDKYIGYPNAIGDLLIITLPIASYLTAKKSKYFSLSLVLLLSGLYLTYSRGSYLAVILQAFASLVLLLQAYKRNFKNKKLYATIIGILLASVMSASLINIARDTNHSIVDLSDKITLNSDEKSSSVNERLEFYQASIQIIKDHPATGVGSDGFQFVYPQYQEFPFTSSNHPHNLFLKIATENGLATALALLMLLILTLYKAFTSKSELVKVFGISLLGLIAHNQIDYNLNFTPIILLMFLLLGLILNQSNSKNSPLFTTKILVGTLVIILTYISINDGYFNYHFQNGRGMLNQKQYQEAELEFKKAKGLIFERRIKLSMAEVLTEQNKLSEALEAYQEATNVNTLDAQAFNSLGELLQKLGLTEIANNNFATAYELDGKNNLGFFLNKYAGRETINKEDEQEALAVLKNFIPVIQNNQHNIILTNNPESAVKIAELFYKKTNKEEFKTLQEQLSNYKKVEEEKFTQKFGFDFTSLSRE